MPVRKVTSVAKPVAKKPVVPKTVAAQAAEAPVVGRLITPTHVAADAKSSVPSMPVAPQKQPAPAPSPVPVAAGCRRPGSGVRSVESRRRIRSVECRHRAVRRRDQRRRTRQVRARFRNAGCASSAAENHPRARNAFVRRRGAANPVSPPRPHDEGPVATVAPVRAGKTWPFVPSLNRSPRNVASVSTGQNGRN